MTLEQTTIFPVNDVLCQIFCTLCFRGKDNSAGNFSRKKQQSFLGIRHQHSNHLFTLYHLKPNHNLSKTRPVLDFFHFLHQFGIFFENYDVTKRKLLCLEHTPLYENEQKRKGNTYWRLLIPLYKGLISCFLKYTLEFNNCFNFSN